MKRFEIGDYVVCIVRDHYRKIKYGDKLQVIGVSRSSGGLTFPGHFGTGYAAKNFKLYVPEERVATPPQSSLDAFEISDEPLKRKYYAVMYNEDHPNITVNWRQAQNVVSADTKEGLRGRIMQRVSDYPHLQNSKWAILYMHSIASFQNAPYIEFSSMSN